MKKMHTNYFFAGLLGLALFSSCSKDKDKDEDKEPAGKPITVANIAGTYKWGGATLDNINIPLEDLELEACEKDDLYKLNADLSAEYIDAGVQCDPPGDDETTWELEGKRILMIDFEGEVEKITDKEMVIAETFRGEDNKQHTIRLIMKRQ
ncbi:MAG: lipocalin family protein [Candidatus Pseudobacter hemicellulosilyticus]|uniref:Lipocalin family protein n=1 Tax=Candidatus Pseudobacter hemicellulosilyticus TaxID=3121375 RepID=A0AAJ5WV60_9BACT|nr:MAG: lipocalin family protein [Pseudobacter sp.]